MDIDLHLFQHWSHCKVDLEQEAWTGKLLGPVGPGLLPCDPGKGIIRGRNGDQRPREMNSGAPGKKCGGMKGG